MVRLSFLRLTQAIVKEATATSPVVVSALQRLPPLPSPKELLRLYKIRAQRNLSQNFLLDPKITNKIVTRTGKVRDCYVCEVGPGPGNITRSILQNGAKHVMVIEKDKRFLPSLELLADASCGRLRIVLGDIMDLTLGNILPKNLAHDWNVFPPPLYIIGNLPFNISTPLIIRWMRHCSNHTGPFIHGRTQLTLTFQKEVANRMVAKAGSDVRCRLSIMCQHLCHVNNMFTIPGRAFFPKPEVDVCVVKFTPRIRPLINQPFDLVEKVVSTIFQHRQKFSGYGIKNLFPENRPDLVEEIITKTRINPEIRSFQLEMEEFKALCDVYSQICQNNKGIRDFNYRMHGKNVEKVEVENVDLPEDENVDLLEDKNVDSFQDEYK